MIDSKSHRVHHFAFDIGTALEQRSFVSLDVTIRTKFLKKISLNPHFKGGLFPLMFTAPEHNHCKGHWGRLKRPISTDPQRSVSIDPIRSRHLARAVKHMLNEVEGRHHAE